ncbi:MAG: EAL domain-containing protein [Rhodospirillales bacterium]
MQNEMVRVHYAGTPTVLVSVAVNATLIALIFDGAVAPGLLFTWIGLMMAMIAGRILIWDRYRRNSGAAAVATWERLAVLGSAASGLLWGMAGFCFYPAADEASGLVLSFIIGGMGAGAATALASNLPAFYAFLGLSILPFTLRLSISDGEYHLLMAVSCLLFLVSLIVLTRRASRWLHQSLLLRFENAELVQSLERRVNERTTQLQEMNTRLSLDIAERRRTEAALADYAERQQTVAAFGERALSGVDLDVLFDDAARIVTERLRAAEAAVLEHVPDRHLLLPRQTSASPESATAGAEMADRHGPAAGVAIDPRTTVVSTEVARETRFEVPPTLSVDAACSLAAVVIPGRDRPFGALQATAREPNRFSAEDVGFLQSIATMLAAAIDRKRTEADIQRLAFEDPLTGLPNRALFLERLQRDLATAGRSCKPLALLLLDLDHFKDVNDTLGHPIGDLLLAAVAMRLRDCVRDADAPARLGGDEFALTVPDLRCPEGAASVAAKIIDAIAPPFLIEGHEITVGASIGLTVCPADGTDADTLLRNADLALYRAKTEGRNTYQFFAPQMAAQVDTRKRIENDLRRALDRSELRLHFQPQYDLVTQHIVGVEALVRWQHPTRGLLMPDEFIPVAEASGLLVPLGKWVIEMAFQRAGEWRRQGLPPIFTAVNVSLSQWRRSDLATIVEDLARRFQCDLNWLELEVTEQVFLPSEGSDCVAGLRRLQGRGVTVSIDDFGTGYSSLGRLHGLPVNRVKIDRCFVASIGRSRDAEMIVRAMIALTRSLGLEVMAEGVETEEQVAFLRREGCQAAQGYFFGPPMPAVAVAALLASQAQPRPQRRPRPWSTLSPPAADFPIALARVEPRNRRWS